MRGASRLPSRHLPGPVALRLTTCLLAAAAAAVQATPRPVAPRGPLPAAEQAVVHLFEQAAPSVAYITTDVITPGGSLALSSRKARAADLSGTDVATS
jgi:hypothetical protein